MQKQVSITLPRQVGWVLGLLSKRSCYRADGNPKQRYPSFGSASSAAYKMKQKNGREFDVYRCLRCWIRNRFRHWQWHIGGTMNPAADRYTCSEPGCIRGRATGHALFRTSPKGELFEGKCRDHLNGSSPAEEVQVS